MLGARSVACSSRTCPRSGGPNRPGRPDPSPTVLSGWRHQSLQDFSAAAIDGTDTDLATYDGKVVLVVNTASQCGFTAAVQGPAGAAGHLRRPGLGRARLPVRPVRQPGAGDEAEISDFCERNFGVTFPLFSKVDVNGDDAHPLFAWLRDSEGRPARQQDQVELHEVPRRPGRPGHRSLRADHQAGEDRRRHREGAGADRRPLLATHRGKAVIEAQRQAIWDALVDTGPGRPDDAVRAAASGPDDEHWSWQLSGLEVLRDPDRPGVHRADDLHRPRAHPVRPPGARPARPSAPASTAGTSWPRSADGTRLRTTMEVVARTSRCPGSRRPAVTATMKRVMATMGDRFSRNLLDHLGVRS